ncbi:ZIP family metal transporter [Patescibacteria group bacterium]|nr:MAG: ZIP family metal transporter [Patescibacteria group bacterium]
MLTNIILANVLMGLVGVVGAYVAVRFLAKNHDRLVFLVSFAAGSLIAVSFFDLLPEAVEAHGDLGVILQFVVAGILIFLLIEKALLYYHCHDVDCHEHGTTGMIILGDSFHNFLDGVAIAGSFLAGWQVGIFTTLAIIIHEIPQEVGDMGVLMHGGYSRAKALAYNFLSALTAILGGLIGYYFLRQFEQFIPYILALVAGGFIYIAAADLLPKLNHANDSRWKIFLNSLCVVSGVAVIWLLAKFVGE